MNYEKNLLSLALPCYNESENITEVIDATVMELEKFGMPWEMIIIDNKSTDATAEVARARTHGDDRFRLIVHQENRFYSGSCATAIREARGEYIVIMDSDGQFSAVDIPAMFARLKAGANLVIGWRKERKDPISRLLMSMVFNAIGKIRLGYPLHDLNCGIRMFDRKFASVAEIRHRINMVNPEFYVRALNAGLKLDEVVITHAERTKGTTSHDLRKLWKLFVQVNQYFRTLSHEIVRK